MADKRSSNTATTTTRKPTKTARPKQSVVASTPKQRLSRDRTLLLFPRLLMSYGME